MPLVVRAARIQHVSILGAKVQDFQSIQDVSVHFGDFTVLVGPSNSGKSAFLRALRAVVRNTFVPSNVRQGAAKSVIDLLFRGAVVGIERGKSLSTYKVGSQVFTKSGRTVPTEVGRALEFPLIEGTDATFAFQFDKPFLLSEPGSQAAQVIGSLTNVSMLHTAVREANRRRLEAAGVLKVRQGDIARLSAQAGEYRGLKERKRVLDAAADLVTEAAAHEATADTLRSAVATVTRAQTALDTLVAEEPADVAPLLAEVAALVQRHQALERNVLTARTLDKDLRGLAQRAREHRDDAARLEADHHTMLRDLRVCPTCGQSI